MNGDTRPIDGSLPTGIAGAVAVVTGCSSGIGLALARRLAADGALVIGVGRDEGRLQEARRGIAAASPRGECELLRADLSRGDELRRLADGIGAILDRRSGGALRVLVNNAGLYSSWYRTSAEGFELQFAVNVLAPFVLSHLLLGRLAADGYGRVVTVSSGSHYRTRLRWDDLQLSRRYTGLGAYKSTKLMDVMIARELDRRLAGRLPLRSYAADPGLVATDMGFKGGGALTKAVWAWRKSKGRPPEEAAAGLAFLAEALPAPPRAPYWKDGMPRLPSSVARDDAACRRLWKELERMSGIVSSDYGLEE